MFVRDFSARWFWKFIQTPKRIPDSRFATVVLQFNSIIKLHSIYFTKFELKFSALCQNRKWQQMATMSRTVDSCRIIAFACMAVAIVLRNVFAAQQRKFNNGFSKVKLPAIGRTDMEYPQQCHGKYALIVNGRRKKRPFSNFMARLFCIRIVSSATSNEHFRLLNLLSVVGVRQGGCPASLLMHIYSALEWSPCNAQNVRMIYSHPHWIVSQKKKRECKSCVVSMSIDVGDGCVRGSQMPKTDRK